MALVLGQLPVDPGELIVLAVDVVVAALGPTDLVAVGDHRDTLAEQECGEEVALLLPSQGVDRGVVGLALYPAVPGPVVALAVVVCLSVGRVVLLVVGHEVTQGETVVCHDEVDRGDRTPGRMRVKVAGTRDARSELAQRGRLTPPEIAHRVAELAVPLGPQRGEVADLVAAVTEVPRLSDELDLRDHGILLDLS